MVGSLTGGAEHGSQNSRKKLSLGDRVALEAKVRPIVVRVLVAVAIVARVVVGAAAAAPEPAGAAAARADEVFLVHGHPHAAGLRVAMAALALLLLLLQLHLVRRDEAWQHLRRAVGERDHAAGSPLVDGLQEAWVEAAGV